MVSRSTLTLLPELRLSRSLFVDFTHHIFNWRGLLPVTKSLFLRLLKLILEFFAKFQPGVWIGQDFGDRFGYYFSDETT